MKKFVIFLTIAIFVNLTVVVVFATNFNRSSSTVQLETNTTYGSAYNAPTILSMDKTGTDYDDPLYSTESSWQGYTDDGYSGVDWISDDFYHPQETDIELNEILETGLFFEDNLCLQTFYDGINSGLSGAWRSKNYIKQFVIDAYAYLGCYTDYKKYETVVEKMHVKVPAWLTIYESSGGDGCNERNPHIHTIYGPFSKSEYVAGYADGWNYELSSDYALAKVKATGENPSTEAKHSTEAFAPTRTKAVDVTTDCYLCNNYGCSACQ